MVAVRARVGRGDLAPCFAFPVAFFAYPQSRVLDLRRGFVGGAA
jgi:hypothetical protein